MRHRAEMIAAILAVLQCGGCYIPAEPDFPSGRIHDMMAEAEVDFILTEQAFAEEARGLPAALHGLRDLRRGGAVSKAGGRFRPGTTGVRAVYVRHDGPPEGRPV